MMTDNFTHDVFLSYSSNDKAVVRAIAERLRSDGLNVWFDQWEIQPGDNIPAKIEEGLEYSRVLVLCMSTTAFGSEWAQLEAGTFRFRDPLNKERRFIPLRLDETPIRGSLAQFLYINWVMEEREQEYEKLLEACLPRVKTSFNETQPLREQFAEKNLQLESESQIYTYAFSQDGKRALSGGDDGSVSVWNIETGLCLGSLAGHAGRVETVAWSYDERRALSGAWDETIRLWDVETMSGLSVLEDHAGYIFRVAWSRDQRHILSCSYGKTVCLWDIETARIVRVFEGHTNQVVDVAWNSDQLHALSCSHDCTVRLWDLKTGACLRVLEGHTGPIYRVAWSPDGRRALSGATDNTARLWDLTTGQCLNILEGHTGAISTVKWSSNQRDAITGSHDGTVRLWDVESGHCLRVLRGHSDEIRSVGWLGNEHYLLSGDGSGEIRWWNLSDLSSGDRASELRAPVATPVPDQVNYTNAKVLLVGESGAGKTGLSRRLALNEWEPSDSTVGAWATQLKLTASAGDNVEREVWLWDFGGQADQRLIHQLYMDETALAILVFDGQREDVFETLGQWDRDLTRASLKPFNKLLVAGRVDAGALRVSRTQIESFRTERGYLQLLETSAKTNIGCEELKKAILASIRWDDIPWRSSSMLFKRLKEEIVRLKDTGRVLMRFNELRDTLQMRLSGKIARFTDEQLKAVVTLLTGPGVVWELRFGSWVLLQPEHVNAYAQAVIQTLRADEQERGCLPEERVLNGDLTYHSSMPRLEPEEERFVLLAMHQTLVERGLCLRQPTARGIQLVFPSYYRRERKELVGAPAVLVSYRFNGFLDDIYATLVVRLHHTEAFEQDQLWRYAADFKTLTGKQLGVKLTRRAEGAGELEVYFDPSIDIGEKIIFAKYVHEHLLKNAVDVVRLRNYVCPTCFTPVGNREVAMERLEEWMHGRRPEASFSARLIQSWIGPDSPTIICARCENRVALWDDLEQHFASTETKHRVRDLQTGSTIMLDNESKERALVGEVVSTVALAGQLSREFNVSDHGIDMEIEFKSDTGDATGKKVYLQLKSGDSYLRYRKRDDAEVYDLDERHGRYWMEQAFPVLLVIRDSKGEVRWMEVREWLKRESDNGNKLINQIVFKGERLDVMSVRRLRDQILSLN